MGFAALVRRMRSEFHIDGKENDKWVGFIGVASTMEHKEEWVSWRR